MGISDSDLKIGIVIVDQHAPIEIDEVFLGDVTRVIVIHLSEGLWGRVRVRGKAKRRAG